MCPETLSASGRFLAANHRKPTEAGLSGKGSLLAEGNEKASGKFYFMPSGGGRGTEDDTDHILALSQ